MYDIVVWSCKVQENLTHLTHPLVQKGTEHRLRGTGNLTDLLNNYCCWRWVRETGWLEMTEGRGEMENYTNKGTQISLPVFSL